MIIGDFVHLNVRLEKSYNLTRRKKSCGSQPTHPKFRCASREQFRAMPFLRFQGFFSTFNDTWNSISDNTWFGYLSSFCTVHVWKTSGRAAKQHDWWKGSFFRKKLLQMLQKLYRRLQNGDFVSVKIELWMRSIWEHIYTPSKGSI